ncbi:MAG: SMC family ATPase [Methanomassiliicoccales archaeon]
MDSFPGELSPGEGRQIQGSRQGIGVLGQGGGRIRLRHLELRNYRRFRYASLDIPEGVVGILGPNGSGKSTLMEAVAWALYGNEGDIVRQGKAGVRSALASMNDECSVTLDFEISGDQYKVYRAMKGKSLSVEAQLTVNGKQLARGDKGVTEEVRRILGMDYKSFFISVFARQKELNALSALKPAERGKVVRRMLGIESLTRTVEEIDRDRNRLQDRFSDLQKDLQDEEGRYYSKRLRQELDSMRLEIERAEEVLRNLAIQEQGMSAAMAQATSRRDLLTKKEERYRSLQTSLLMHRKDKEAAEAALTRAVEMIEELKSKARQAAALQAEAEEYEKSQSRKEELDSLAKENARKNELERQHSSLVQNISRLRESLRSFENAEKLRQELNDQLAAVEASIEQLKAEQGSTRESLKVRMAEAERLTKEIDKARLRLKEIERLGPEGVCPTCERKLCDQHSFLTEKLRKEMEDMERERSRLNSEAEREREELAQKDKRLEALNKRRKHLQGQYEQQVKAVTNKKTLLEQLLTMERDKMRLEQELSPLYSLRYDEKEYLRLKQRLADLKPKWERRKELLAEVQSLERWQKEQEEQTRRIARCTSLIERLEEEITQLGYKEGERQEAQRALDELLRQKQELDKEISRVQNELSRLRAESGMKENRLSELLEKEAKLAELTVQVMEQTALGQAMRAFRESMMARVVPTLSELSSRLLSELTDGRYVGMKLDSDYEISILDRGEEYPLMRFSGGEVDLANLCLRLAISKVIAERAGSALNLLILDEIFGSQDQMRKRNIMEAFSQLSRQFSQILLITHIDDVKDMVGAAIVVRENEDGSSSASVVI